MDGSGVCTSCSAEAELNADAQCSDCAPASSEAPPADEPAAPAEDGEEEAA